MVADLVERLRVDLGSWTPDPTFDTRQAAAERIEALEAALREHHNWHLQAGIIGLQDGDGGWIEIDNAAEYSDSAMHERTIELLADAPPQDLQPIPRGGMNTWWWEQAVILRRKLRASDPRLEVSEAENARLRKVASDCAAALGNGAGVSPASSLEFIEMLPGEIAKCTDRLRRFLKCARDEGAEALTRADAAESALAEAERRAEQADRALSVLAPVRDMLILCGELGGMLPGETMADYLRRLIDEVAGKEQNDAKR